MTSHPKTPLLALFFFLSLAISAAQDEQFASFQLINGTSVPLIGISINGRNWYPEVKPGQTSSGGKTSLLSRDIKVTDAASKATVAGKALLSPQKSFTWAVVGDFQLVPKDPGDPKSKLEPRVKFLLLENNFGPEESGHRLRIVNGIVDEPLTVSFEGGDTLDIPPFETASKSSLPRNVKVEIRAGAQSSRMSFLYIPPERGVTIVPYKLDGVLKCAVANETVLTPTGERPAADEAEIEKTLEEERARGE